jgi:hypothetical protein
MSAKDPTLFPEYRTGCIVRNNILWSTESLLSDRQLLSNNVRWRFKTIATGDLSEGTGEEMNPLQAPHFPWTQLRRLKLHPQGKTICLRQDHSLKQYCRSLRMIGDADKASRTFSEMSVEADSAFWTPGGGWPCHPLLNCTMADIDIASCSTHASIRRLENLFI